MGFITEEPRAIELRITSHEFSHFTATATASFTSLTTSQRRAVSRRFSNYRAATAMMAEEPVMALTANTTTA